MELRVKVVQLHAIGLAELSSAQSSEILARLRC
jgi:hypothetical protein